VLLRRMLNLGYGIFYLEKKLADCVAMLELFIVCRWKIMFV
jgi:hypothetical protein